MKIINNLKLDKDSKGLAATQIKTFIDNFIDKDIYILILFKKVKR